MNKRACIFTLDAFFCLFLFALFFLFGFSVCSDLKFTTLDSFLAFIIFM